MSFRFKQGQVLSLFLPFLLLFTLPSGTLADVVLNEFIADAVSDWSGDGLIDYKNDEWVEIINRGDTGRDIDEYWLSDSVDDPAVRYRFSGTLPAGEVFQVTGAMAVDWQAENDAGSAGLSLGNTGGFVALFRDTPDGAVLIDSVEYLSYQISDDRALGRFPEDTETWILFDGLNIYHGNQEPGSTGCMPSPSEENVCDASPARDASWGEVKRAYPSSP